VALWDGNNGDDEEGLEGRLTLDSAKQVINKDKKEIMNEKWGWRTMGELYLSSLAPPTRFAPFSSPAGVQEERRPHKRRALLRTCNTTFNKGLYPE